MNTAPTPTPDVSIVVPIYNEVENLPDLVERIAQAMSAQPLSFELLAVDDGSRDGSADTLRELAATRPWLRPVFLARNYGQSSALQASFDRVRGRYVVTLDADLQNPPEDIGLLLAEMDAGHDYVGSIRRQRNDSWWRHVASRAMNRLRERITHIKMTDQGCMMRAYSRRIIDTINRCNELYTFIPALAYQFAQNPTEVVVGHEERFAGESKYSLYSLIRLNFDLMTGFSVVPLQVFSLIGTLVSLLSGVLVVYLGGRRLILGPEEGGLFTLFAIAFLLIGLALFGIGLLGEYIGRIYQEVRQRPRYVIDAVLEQSPAPESPQP